MSVSAVVCSNIFVFGFVKRISFPFSFFFVEPVLMKCSGVTSQILALFVIVFAGALALECHHLSQNN